MTAEQAKQRARDRLAVREHNAQQLIDRVRARVAARRASADAALLARVTAERPTRPARATRRLWSIDGLLMASVWMYGPRWRRHFAVVETPIVELDPEAAKYHRPGRKLLTFTLEDDVRELIMDPINPALDRVAMWSDPRERLGL